MLEALWRTTVSKKLGICRVMLLAIYHDTREQLLNSTIHPLLLQNARVLECTAKRLRRWPLTTIIRFESMFKGGHEAAKG